VRPGRTALLAAAVAVTCLGCLLRRTRTGGHAVAPVDYVRRSFQSSLAGCSDPSSHIPAPCVRLDVEYVEPTRSSVALAKAVGRFVAAAALHPLAEGAPLPDVETLRDELYDAYGEIQQRVPDYRVPWVIERKVTVACNTARLQGLVASERSFTGGAHRTERVEYRSFETESGTPIGLDALVAPENRAAFAAEVERRAHEGGPTGLWPTPQTAKAALPDQQLAGGENLLVCPDTITFRWPRSGASGDTEVVVPRAEVRALLRADAP